MKVQNQVDELTEKLKTSEKKLQSILIEKQELETKVVSTQFLLENEEKKHANKIKNL